MIKRVCILMKKWYSLAQRRWLNQIQYSLNLQAFRSSWIEGKKKKKLEFQRRDKLNWKKWTLKQIQSHLHSTTACFFPCLYQSHQIASVVFNLNHEQLSLTIVHVLLTGSYSIFWHCWSQSHYRAEWCKQPFPCVFLICMEQEAWWNVCGCLEGQEGVLQKSAPKPCRSSQESPGQQPLSPC